MYLPDDIVILDDVQNFLKLWTKQQDNRVRDQLGLFIFPQCVSIGFTFIEDSSNFTSNEDLQRVLTLISQWERKVIEEVAEITTDHSLSVDSSQFQSKDEINCFFGAINEELICDFTDWFKIRFNQELQESSQDEEPFAKVLKMVCIGMGAIEYGFQSLMSVDPDNEDFHQDLHQYYNSMIDELRETIFRSL